MSESLWRREQQTAEQARDANATPAETLSRKPGIDRQISQGLTDAEASTVSSLLVKSFCRQRAQNALQFSS